MSQFQFTIENSLQYLQEFHDFYNFIEIESKDLNKNPYTYPVITIFCKHIKIVYNLDMVLQQINSTGQFTCQECNQSISHPNRLQKDIRWKLKEEINEYFDTILVIHNHLFPKFLRNKKYKDLILENTVPEIIKNLIETQNSINIKQILESYDIQNLKQREIIFKAICLLDYVQVSLPVRFKACRHPECYELSSLLFYQKENQQDQLKQFVCKQRNCKIKVDISTQEKLFENIYMDNELLRIIKKGLPSIHKYKYNTITHQIEQDSKKQDGLIIDPFIFSLFQREFGLQFSVLDSQFLEYQRNITQHSYYVLQQVPDKKIQLKLKLNKYRTFQLRIIDQIIEQPSRCINCNISNVMDLKSIISNFYLQKKKQQRERTLKCPLCQYEYMINATISNLTYFDQNLFNAFEQGILIQKEGNLYYDGKKLMIEEFQQKQKLEIEDFKQNIKEKQKNLRYTFSQLFCSSNPQLRIQFPLILQKCPQQKIVEFENFYNKITQLEQQDYEQNCLRFCSCDYCQNNAFSFKDFPENVYFHEAFYKALIDFRKSNVNQNIQQFTYDFERNIVIEEQQIVPQQQQNFFIKRSLFKQGFVSLLDDEQYQKRFEKKLVDNQYYFQISQNKLNTPFGTLINNKEGFYCEENKKLSQQIQQNQEKNDWGFQIKKTETKIKTKSDGIVKGKISLDWK
ncbi:unnamed protein product [Paramecium sonneborni]|uniref:Uncharacterized protein n=1 Tax=Paramecium sonneborni TaxID=65129 RepID=A0A8S1QUG8_9CILI|nr:unnamed protein product [Paramecium sonneborni]